MTNDASLRKHLVAMLDGGHAYAPFAKIIADLPPKLRGEVPKGLPHSAWMLLEHLRLAQRDILDFSRDPNYVAPKWPDDYWPKASSPPSAAAWDKSVRSFQEDLEAMKKLVSNPKTELVAKIPWGEGQTILREALLVADHNAHHLGQMIDVRRLLGIWGK
jgi:DinB superfamily